MKESEESKFKAEIDAIEDRIKTILNNIEKVAPIAAEKDPPAAPDDPAGDGEAAPRPEEV